MNEVALFPLVGTNPLGFFAALGALDVLQRSDAVNAPTLRWTDDLVPHAVLGGARDLDHLIACCDGDRHRWLKSMVLSWESETGPLSDLKPQQQTLRRWGEAVAATLPAGRTEADLFCALVAEGAVAGKGDAKPTHLHFTAGQQRFLDMVRHLAAAVSPGDFVEALRGPWAYEKALPSLGWDVRGERIYALRGINPATEQRPGIPGADWLAFLGLTFFPVATSGNTLRTTGCSPAWKRGWFRWPLWSAALSPRTVRSLLGDPTVGGASAEARRARGIPMVLQAAIRRSDQGGYGSFGPATLAAPSIQPPRRGARRSPTEQSTPRRSARRKKT